MTTHDYLRIVAKRVRRYEDDEFFKDGNLGRLSSVMLPSESELSHIQQQKQQENKEESNDSTMDDGNDDLYLIDKSGFTCRWLHCNATFSCLAEYDKHIHQAHSHSCNDCSRSFPSSHLLDIHITETHDSYFAAQVDAAIAAGNNGSLKKKLLYMCYVQGCSIKSASNEDRLHHLKVDHAFPSSYSPNWALGSTMTRDKRNKAPATGKGTVSSSYTSAQSKTRNDCMKQKLIQRKPESSDSKGVSIPLEGNHICSLCKKGKGRRGFSINQLKKVMNNHSSQGMNSDSSGGGICKICMDIRSSKTSEIATIGTNLGNIYHVTPDLSNSDTDSMVIAVVEDDIDNLVHDMATLKVVPKNISFGRKKSR